MEETDDIEQVLGSYELQDYKSIMKDDGEQFVLLSEFDERIIAPWFKRRLFFAHRRSVSPSQIVKLSRRTWEEKDIGKSYTFILLYPCSPDAAPLPLGAGIQWVTVISLLSGLLSMGPFHHQLST